MINILDKEKCVGCNACTQICPKECIQMNEDHEGFLYPKVNVDNCIECSLCEKVCPIIHQGPAKEKPLYSYALKNNNQLIRNESSSGGFFSLLAEEVLKRNGVVFGVRFDHNWDVIHDEVFDSKDLKLYRGSKYVQSRIDENYSKAKQYLEEGRFVLFSGTPCQIAGFKRFLRKDYENLFCVDFICHGVPSPKVWRIFRKELLANYDIDNRFSEIAFRSKSKGWKDYSFYYSVKNKKNQCVSFEELYWENSFMKGFLQDLYLRPSCYACPAKDFKSQSDITFADFWGIEKILPTFADNKGISLVMTSTVKGNNFITALSLSVDKVEVDFHKAVLYNPSIFHSAKPHPKRNIFFRYYLHKKSIKSWIDVCLKPSLINRLNIRFRVLIMNILKNG